MYTRLAFAIAAHLKPDILLIDEVLAVGDLAFQRKCLGKIDAISKDGRTVIFVSHQMSMIRALCSRAVWLNLGKTVKDGIVDIVINEYERMYSKERIEVSQDFIKRDTSFLKNKTFYVDFIKILNEGGNPSNRFRYNESIKILVHFSGESSSPTYNLEVRIFDETDRLIIVESTAFHGLLLTRDVKLISFEINELKLTAGTYKLSLSAVDSQIDNRLDNWNECGFFEIYECSPFGFGHNLKNPTEGICAFASNIVILNP
jgi:lipopolysaccharide transport system ATP-binding protein